jgi:hypothetical protein
MAALQADGGVCQLQPGGAGRLRHRVQGVEPDRRLPVRHQDHLPRVCSERFILNQILIIFLQRGGGCVDRGQSARAAQPLQHRRVQNVLARAMLGAIARIDFGQVTQFPFLSSVKSNSEKRI